MKNRRDVCYAKDAGFIEFNGLSGSIKTGCAATPAFKSRYCSVHENQACHLLYSEEVDEDMDTPTGPTLRSGRLKKCDGELVAEMILAKKITRKQTYYQVMCTCPVVLCEMVEFCFRMPDAYNLYSHLWTLHGTILY